MTLQSVALAYIPTLGAWLIVGSEPTRHGGWSPGIVRSDTAVSLTILLSSQDVEHTKKNMTAE
jgi:hypothetical protein